MVIGLQSARRHGTVAMSVAEASAAAGQAGTGWQRKATS